MRAAGIETFEAVGDGGRLVTITGDPPRPERGRVGATVPLAEAAAALRAASAGRASGATVLTLSHSPRDAASEPLATS